MPAKGYRLSDGDVRRGQYSKPAPAAKPRVISREDIRERAHELLADLGKATPTELAQRIETEPSMVAIALSADARFVRAFDAGVMRWTLAAEKAKAAPWPPKATGMAAMPAATQVVAEVPHAIRLVIEEAGAARAQQLLNLSRGNRVLREQHVKWLERQILEGCWRLTPSSIAISATGRLLDGHHRLEAIVRAQKTVLVPVTYGWPDDAWDAIDCGVVRLVQDRFALIADSTTWNQRAVEIIHAILRIENGVRLKLTNAQLMTAWTRFGNGIKRVRTLFPTPDFKVLRTAFIAALVRYHEIDADRAIAFAREYDQPLEEAPRTPPQHLLRWMASGEFVGIGRKGQVEQYWRCVYAMAAHRAGRSIDGILKAGSWDGEPAPATEAPHGR